MKENNVKYRVIGSEKVHLKEYSCWVPANFINVKPDSDIVAFGRWLNTGKPFLSFRVNKRKSSNNLFFISENQFKEIIKWFKEKKKETKNFEKR